MLMTLPITLAVRLAAERAGWAQPRTAVILGMAFGGLGTLVVLSGFDLSTENLGFTVLVSILAGAIGGVVWWRVEAAQKRPI